jgi:DNA-binding transcriptional ArsR family regulator
MVNYPSGTLDAVFAALADSTRRGVITMLSRRAARVSELAAPAGMSLPGFMKHLSVLETAGLIRRAKSGRVVTCELDGSAMREAAEWLDRYQQFWDQRLDALGRYLAEEDASCPQPPNKRRSPSSALSKRRGKKSGARSRNPKR